MKKTTKSAASRKSPPRDLPSRKNPKAGFAPQPEPPKTIGAQISQLSRPF